MLPRFSSASKIRSLAFTQYLHQRSLFQYAALELFFLVARHGIIANEFKNAFAVK
jgi:hypothetical protein